MKKQGKTIVLLTLAPNCDKQDINFYFANNFAFGKNIQFLRQICEYFHFSEYKKKIFVIFVFFYISEVEFENIS